MQQEQSVGTTSAVPSAMPVSVSTSTSSPAPAPTPTPEYTPAQPIKEPAGQRPLYSAEQQQHFNDVLKAEKQKAYEKGLKESQYQAAPAIPEIRTPSANTPSINEQQMKEMIGKEFTPLLQKTLQEYQMQAIAEQQKRDDEQLAQELLPKIEAAKQKYADFGEKVDLGIFDHNRNWFKALNSVDNAGEVIYELQNDSVGKFMNLHSLLTSENKSQQSLGHRQLQAFAQSLKNNEASASKKIPHEPLGELRPSKVNSSGNTDVTKWGREYAKGKI
jgi:hypothetical protein